MSVDAKPLKQMVGGCCVCSDERGWSENPLVYCDGDSCSVAVHQACYGILQVPTGSWFCRKCESQERAARVKCDLCPNKEGALKRTEAGTWAHVVCALYIPEVRFGNNLTMEPIVLRYIPQDRFNKSCYICEQQGRRGEGAGSRLGACMSCNRAGCRLSFHVTCAQSLGLLCEEEGNSRDNVKYCGYCATHYPRKPKKGEPESDTPCDGSDAGARVKKAEARNGPLASAPSLTQPSSGNGLTEPSVIEAANCLADMKRYDACRSSIDGTRQSPALASSTPQSQPPAVVATNGFDSALITQMAAGPVAAEFLAITKTDQSACHASTNSSDSNALLSPDIANLPVIDPCVRDFNSAKSAPSKRLPSQQRRRAGTREGGSRSREPSSAAGVKAAKRQKLQSPPRGDQPQQTGTASSNATVVSNGPVLGPASSASPLRQGVIAQAGPSVATSSASEDRTASLSPVPQSMQQLLEKQFEQGSQFLMEQAQYFDIASLLGCLAQLQAENKQLEDTLRALSARRDHLASVNARLSLPLSTVVSMHSATGAIMGGSGGPYMAGGGRQVPLSPRLSPRGAGDMGMQPQSVLQVGPSGVAASPHAAGASSARLLEAADHHLQQQFVQQQQQQFQHMMMMVQSHPGVAANLPSAVAPQVVPGLGVSTNAGMNHGLVVPTPQPSAFGQSAAFGNADGTLVGQGYVGNPVAHGLHMMPTVNTMAAVAAAVSVQQHPSSTALGSAAAMQHHSSLAAGASGSGGSAFSPAGHTKLPKGDRKTS